MTTVSTNKPKELMQVTCTTEIVLLTTVFDRQLGGIRW